MTGCKAALCGRSEYHPCICVFSQAAAWSLLQAFIATLLLLVQCRSWWTLLRTRCSAEVMTRGRLQGSPVWKS